MMLARFLNLMGRETIRILGMMTTKIKGVFVHSAIVDRVVSMFYYFLNHLAGAKKRSFEVKVEHIIELNKFLINLF